MPISHRRICTAIKTLLVQLVCLNAYALPNPDVAVSYAQCIAAANISYAELRMVGEHAGADTFQNLSRRLYGEITASANTKQESIFIEVMIDSELKKYHGMGSKQQLSYAIHVLERNQCNRLKL